MDFKSMLAKAKANTGGKKSGPPKQSVSNALIHIISNKGIAIRGCSAVEVANWQLRVNTNMPLPSSNGFTSGTGYALEVGAGQLYDERWLAKLTKSIETCKNGGCECLVILKDNVGYGTNDYPTHLNKVPILNSAMLVSWLNLRLMTVEQARDLLLAILTPLPDDDSGL